MIVNWIPVACRGSAKDTRGTAFVVYEDIFEAKNAVDNLSGFNVANRYLIVLYYNTARNTKKVGFELLRLSCSWKIQQDTWIFSHAILFTSFVVLPTAWMRPGSACTHSEWGPICFALSRRYWKNCGTIFQSSTWNSSSQFGSNAWCDCFMIVQWAFPHFAVEHKAGRRGVAGNARKVWRGWRAAFSEEGCRLNASYYWLSVICALCVIRNTWTRGQAVPNFHNLAGAHYFWIAYQVAYMVFAIELRRWLEGSDYLLAIDLLLTHRSIGFGHERLSRQSNR